MKTTPTFRRALVLALLCGVTSLPVAHAQPTRGSETTSVETAEPGSVQLPLELYNQLVESARDPRRLPRPAPASYALGAARVVLSVSSTEPRATAEVQVELTMDVLEDEWVLVPILPAGTPVDTASVAGRAVQLLASPDGLAWSTRQSGSYTMSLVYRVDAARSPSGYTLAVPVPQAAAINLSATLPGTGLDVAVVPAAGTRTATRGSSTQLTATVPSTRSLQITWRLPSERGHVISRASYSGRLEGSAVSWTAEYGVELFADDTVTLRLLPGSLTLNRLQVDGSSAPILVDEDHFSTLVRGQGLHTVTVGFEAPVERSSGPPRISFRIPAVPVSRFELSLPGRKEVTVQPAATVGGRQRGDATVATVFVPMTDTVSFSWAEAVPEDVRAEVRSNAGLYHAVHAEEGVLYVRALIHYEITRGTTNVLRLEVPSEVQVNRIVAPSGAVADWRHSPARSGQPSEVSVFLDRQLEGELLLEVAYDRSLATEAEAGGIAVPLLRSLDAQRQRGMVALLSSKDIALDPVAEGGATRVGENQLPAFVREAIDLTVAHTFKYTERPQLAVEASEPVREEARFDAQVDTLISLGEVTLRGAASVEIGVKSGSMMELDLGLPAGVNLLSLTGPSLRTHRVSNVTDGQQIAVEFTQEMEGQFRLQVSYERILQDGEAELAVPTLSVAGAEVEQGRIGVEALSAVEVQTTTSDQLTALDVSELPKQLILQTTNPILQAFKYAHTDPPYLLVLKVTRHRLLDVQEAAIDRAHYRTLYTADGLAVTTATFLVRNRSEQFLRVRLPHDFEVWSAFVDDKAEKPALAEEAGSGEGESVLIKIVNSTQGFPVQLIYQTPGPRIRGLGSVRGTLPLPDLLVTESRWDVYLPASMRYAEPRTNMNVVAERVPVNGEALLGEVAALDERLAAQEAVAPLRLSVPTSGVHFAFEKLYANQADEEARFSIPYSSRLGASVGRLLSLLGFALLMAGIYFLWRPHPRLDRRLAVGASAVGLLLLVLTLGIYRISATPLLVLALLAATATAGLYGRRWWEARRSTAGGDGEA